MLEHPAISNAQAFGYPEREKPRLTCPICGEEFDKLAFSKDGEVVGCDCCLTWKYSYEVDNEEL